MLKLGIHLVKQQQDDWIFYYIDEYKPDPVYILLRINEYGIDRHWKYTNKFSKRMIERFADDEQINF